MAARCFRGDERPGWNKISFAYLIGLSIGRTKFQSPRQSCGEFIIYPSKGLLTQVAVKRKTFYYRQQSTQHPIVFKVALASVAKVESLPFRFKAGGEGKMSSAAVAHSHRPTTKVSHKGFKSRKATKSDLRERSKGIHYHITSGSRF